MSNKQLKEKITRIFDSIVEPKLKWNINTLNLLKEIQIENDDITITVNLITENEKEIEDFKQTVQESLKALNINNATVITNRVDVATDKIQDIKNVIFVGAGKGGVGKSSISVNLAVALKQKGFNVGLMDADVYGPSLPTMMGIKDKTPEVLPQDYLAPIDAFGVKVASIGSLVPRDSTLDWRGQVLSGTILQFIYKTFWGKLDYLIVDLPPGTGDAVLTLIHKIKSSGILLVTTPADVALADLQRTVTLMKNCQVPILGVVENMSSFQCESCSHENTLFPKTDFDEMLLKNQITRIASIPFVPKISYLADNGTPCILQEGMEKIASKFGYLADFVNDKVKENTSSIIEFQNTAS